MKYFIAYKQNEDTYNYVISIGNKIETTLFYANALDFGNILNARNICNYLNEIDEEKEYIVIEYQYTLTEV